MMIEFFENPHPPLSGFPIVILTLLVLSEGWSRFREHGEGQRTQNFLVVMLAVFALLTYFSGYWGFDHANKTFAVEEAAILRHQGYAKFFALLVIPLVLLTAVRAAAPLERTEMRQWLQRIWQVLLILLWILAAYVSSLGGDLVFNRGAAVRAPIGAGAAPISQQK